jgi:uncharacterized protein Smg (DUF494 family)
MNYPEHYIKENLRRGISLDAIKKSMLSAGYSQTQIDESVKLLYREQVRDLAKYINSELKYGLSADTVKNYLIAIGHPKEHVDEAIEKIIRLKKYMLKKKKTEKTREQFREISNNIRRNLVKKWHKAKYRWYSFETWKKFAFAPSAVIFIFLLLWEITMMANSIMLSGSLNCYSFGRIVNCSFLESLVFYLLLMLALTVIFCLPVFLLGALIGWLVQRLRG